ncbi:MAG: hypothetical protein R3213_04205 [Flavobacteriaceae bacterium]|nr:hypothetical protein [Flavobacteriaceae bacterium]
MAKRKKKITTARGLAKAARDHVKSKSKGKNKSREFGDTSFGSSNRLILTDAEEKRYQQKLKRRYGIDPRDYGSSRKKKTSKKKTSKKKTRMSKKRT